MRWPLSRNSFDSLATPPPLASLDLLPCHEARTPLLALGPHETRNKFPREKPTAWPRAPGAQGGLKYRPATKLANQAICPHQARDPSEAGAANAHGTYFQTISLAPQHALYADTHSAWEAGPAPRKGWVGVARSNSPPPSKQHLVWCPLAALWAPGPVGPMCVSCAWVHVCKHDFMESRN